jgi:type IV pilus assembly protein PilA
MPQYQAYLQKSEVVEVLSLSVTVKDKVTQYYNENLEFPVDNQTAGLPLSKHLIGNRVTGVVVESGAIHVTMGNKASKPLQGKVLSFRPAVVIGSPTSPISWLCGNDKPVPGMQAVGENKTTLGREFRPSSC